LARACDAPWRVVAASLAGFAVGRQEGALTFCGSRLRPVRLRPPRWASRTPWRNQSWPNDCQPAARPCASLTSLLDDRLTRYGRSVRSITCALFDLVEPDRLRKIAGSRCITANSGPFQLGGSAQHFKAFAHAIAAHERHSRSQGREQSRRKAAQHLNARPDLRRGRRTFSAAPRIGASSRRPRGEGGARRGHAFSSFDENLR
jgi:hypothetical protein